jgi:transposase-like protein
VEELLAERGIDVDHVTIYRWVQRFAPELMEAARSRRHLVGDRWHVDETYVKVGGTWRYLFRAIDQFGQVIDVFLSRRRDANAARRVFARALADTRISPAEVTTGRYRLYPRVLDEFIATPGLPARSAGIARAREGTLVLDRAVHLLHPYLAERLRLRELYRAPRGGILRLLAGRRSGRSLGDYLPVALSGVMLYLVHHPSRRHRELLPLVSAKLCARPCGRVNDIPLKMAT